MDNILKDEIKMSNLHSSTFIAELNEYSEELIDDRSLYNDIISLNNQIHDIIKNRMILNEIDTEDESDIMTLYQDVSKIIHENRYYSKIINKQNEIIEEFKNKT